VFDNNGEGAGVMYAYALAEVRARHRGCEPGKGFALLKKQDAEEVFRWLIVDQRNLQGFRKSV
jgi:hypothetical protein